MSILQRKRLLWAYVLGDLLGSALAWFWLYVFRKTIIEGESFRFSLLVDDRQFYLGLSLIPIGWVVLHYITGAYTDPYRKSRLTELATTALASLIGTLIVFFSLLLDDMVRHYSDYYLTFFVLLGFQFVFTFLFRLMVLSKVKNDISTGWAGFYTLIIGGSQKATEVYESVKGQGLGYKFIGYIELNGKEQNTLTKELKELGKIADLESIVNNHPDLEEVIIAVETSEHHLLNNIINRLADKNLTLKIIPDMYDILSGTVKMTHVLSDAFIELPPQLIPEWQRITKRWFDIFSASAAIFFTLPITIPVMIKIWRSSPGPIFYMQERLGQYGKPFKMYKFRSMYMNAEQHGPQLTQENDNRITPIGQWMRKYRVDEFPQFLNVIKGDMSVVGPRPERKFFADQIVVKAPHYKHIFKVKPGITSLGMVKYGYASNVEEMVKRLKFDVVYIENMSITMDFKIMIYTVLTVLYGRGK
jgi:exopolysaccharide biosynthesis polyprenyl glycosylphosphotransferase